MLEVDGMTTVSGKSESVEEDGVVGYTVVNDSSQAQPTVCTCVTARGDSTGVVEGAAVLVEEDIAPVSVSVTVTVTMTADAFEVDPELEGGDSLLLGTDVAVVVVVEDVVSLVVATPP
jgi:hypothetical protein